MSDSVEASERLNQISGEVKLLRDEIRAANEQLQAMVERALEVARVARHKRVRLETLDAEALYVSLRDGLEWDSVEAPEGRLDDLGLAWRNLRAEMLPVSAEGDWLEKVRELEVAKTRKPFLSEEETRELESRLKDNICPICVSYALDGTCTIQSFDTCPITHYLNRMVSIIEELGHRPWMEDYFERMYRDICPGCSGRVDKNYCPPREDGECSLFTYLPTVVRTIEEFMKERVDNQDRPARNG